MGCVAGDPESGEHRRGGGHRTARPGARSARSPKRDSYVRHSARVCSVSDSAPQSPTTLGRSSPDTALRTPPRPGRAPHDPARGAPAANRIAGTPGGAQVPWGSRAPPAGFRVGAGHGALIESSLTNPRRRGTSGTLGPTLGRTNPAEVPGGPGGRVSARRVRAAVVANLLLYNGVAPGNPGRPASSPARAPSVNKHIHPAAVSL